MIVDLAEFVPIVTFFVGFSAGMLFAKYMGWYNEEDLRMDIGERLEEEALK